MSDPAPAPTPNPKKEFVKEKHEKMDSVKKEVKKLKRDLNKLRANNADSAAKKSAHKNISEKRDEYNTVRKSKFTPPV